MSLDDMQTAKADLHLYLEDLKTREVDDVKKELELNIIPLLQSLVDANISDSEEQWGTLQEVIETMEDVIHPELAGQIIGALELGGTICQLLKASNVILEDELANKRLQDAILTYQRAAILAIGRVAEVTIEPGELDEEGDEDGNTRGEETETEETSATILEAPDVDGSRAGDFDSRNTDGSGGDDDFDDNLEVRGE